MIKRPSLIALLIALALVIAAILYLQRWARQAPAAPDAGPGVSGDAGGGGGPLAPGAVTGGRVIPPSPGPARASRDPAAAAGLLEGRVVARGTSRGVTGAELVFDRDGAVTRVRSDADGAFRLAPPSPGRYVLTLAEAEGYLPFLSGWDDTPVSFEARPGERVSGVVLQLVPASRLRVHVVSEGGEPLGGVELTVGSADSGNLRPDAPAAVTDGGGDAIVGVTTGWRVTARRQGYQDGWGDVGASTLATGLLVLKLAPTGAPSRDETTLGGRVVDARGAPVAGVQVEARGSGPGPLAQAFTDGRGAFTLSPAPARSYLVLARASRLRTAALSGVAAGRRDLELRLPDATSELALRARDADSGAPVSAFAVALEGPLGDKPASPPQSRAILDSEGTCLWRELPAGTYLVYVSAYDYAPLRVKVTLAEGARASVDADLRAGGRVAGAVSAEGSGEPVAGARVLVESSIPEGSSAVPLQAEGATDSDGSFEVAGVAPGPRSISVAATGYHIRIESGVVVKRGEVTRVAVTLTPLAPGEEARTELVGIGAVLALAERELTVQQVVDGGGAALAGLVPGDRIRAIDGRPVAEMAYEDAIEAIRGPAGTRVLLAVARAGTGAAVDVWVERRKIKY